MWYCGCVRTVLPHPTYVCMYICIMHICIYEYVCMYDVLKLYFMGSSACFSCYVLIFQECNQHQKRDFCTYNKWWSSGWPWPCHELVLAVRCWSGWQCHNLNNRQFCSEDAASHCVTATFECPACGYGGAPVCLPCGKEKQAGGS